MPLYRCVVDGKLYDPEKTRAAYKGFCSMRCQHQLAKECGFNRTRTRSSEYAVMNEELRRRRRTMKDAEPITSD